MNPPGILTYFKCGHVPKNVDYVAVEPQYGFLVTALTFFQALKDDDDDGIIGDGVTVIGELEFPVPSCYMSGSRGDKIIAKNQDVDAYHFRVVMVVDDGLLDLRKLK